MLKKISDVLASTFKDAKIVVEDTKGDNYHFEVEIISDSFEGKSNVERHKMVYDALGNWVGNEIHALSLETKTISEAVNSVNSTTTTSASEKDLSTDILKKIDEAIHKFDVILFMKGTKQAPMCGFSMTVANILGSLGVNFQDVNVLASAEIRDNIKVYSNWPTVPQLYVKGSFVGGCDIIKEMYENGELETLLKNNKII